MRVLLTGANGFIGSHLLAALDAAGHAVVAVVRDPAALRRRFPHIEAVHADLNTDLDPAAWGARLDGIEAVVNCAGILQGGRGQSIEAIHHLAPAALFAACAALGIHRVIQISAISAEPAAGTAYALSKYRGDEALRRLDLDWVVLRPSLVYAEGSYGGTSLLRGLAGLPGVVPVVGEGRQAFQPIHADDLARTVVELLRRPESARVTLDPVGPETLTLEQIVVKLRAWLGFPPARIWHVPLWIVRALCRLGDLFGAGPMRTTALDQLLFGNAAPADPFIRAVGFTSKSMDEALHARPAHVQDRWHARLFFVRPVLTLLLALFWIASGLIGLSIPWEDSADFALALGLAPELGGPVGAAASVLDIAIASCIAFGRRPGLAGALQLGVIAAYTIVFTIAAPGLWGDPFGPLLKNVPILGAVLAWMALGEDR